MSAQRGDEFTAHTVPQTNGLNQKKKKSETKERIKTFFSKKKSNQIKSKSQKQKQKQKTKIIITKEIEK